MKGLELMIKSDNQKIEFCQLRAYQRDDTCYCRLNIVYNILNDAILSHLPIMHHVFRLVIQACLLIFIIVRKIRT